MGKPHIPDTVLDWWAEGVKTSEIARRLGTDRGIRYLPDSILNFIHKARKRGDPRAVRRSEGGARPKEKAA